MNPALPRICSAALSLPVLMLFAPSPPLHAAEFCATDSTELAAHLTTASSNGEGDVIRIAAGHYAAPTNGFVYNAMFAGGDDQALAVLGGWTLANADPCGGPPTGDPFATVLDGGGTNRLAWLRVKGDVTVRGLSFENGSTPAFGDGGGLHVEFPNDADYTAQAIVEGNAFVGNEGHWGGGLSMYISRAAGSARLQVTNNVFEGNHARENAGAARLWVTEGVGGAAAVSMVVVGNTAQANTTDNADEGANGGMQIAGPEPVERVIANNNLWSNQDLDLAMFGSGGYALLHNNIEDLGGFEPGSQAGNIAVDPGYQSCASCLPWQPASASALVDAGAHPAQGDIWALTPQDLAGRARVAGAAVDIGAYENHERVFGDGFEDQPAP